MPKFKPIKKELSEVPSLAIRQVLRDLIAVEKDDRYKINMCTFHRSLDLDRQFGESGHCNVCLAGAHMARRINDPNVSSCPGSFAGSLFGGSDNQSPDEQQQAEQISDRIAAFDDLRLGPQNLNGFLNGFGYGPFASRKILKELPSELTEFQEYENDPDLFKDWLDNIADFFEQQGH